MDYRVLGPLEVLDEGGQKVPLGGAMQQSVLASLLLRVEQLVALERLVDDLWDEAPPSSARKTIRVYVSRLRKVLPEGTIERRPGGYALLLNGDRFDLEEFERLAEEGGAALASEHFEHASDLLSKALELWHGPALAGLELETLRREAERLEELRLQTLEDRLEADLASGRSHDLVAELQTIVAEHPLRHRLTAHLMLALYRCGRVPEALAVYRDTHRFLMDELGLEPSEELRTLERAILRTDPSLELPSVTPSNLAAQPTPLVGRQREVAEVRDLLCTKRLLTLTGPGGVGKTRLALEVASETVDNFPDGVWFVSLAAVRDSGLLLPTVAQTLALADPQDLVRYLNGKQVLLVLDNLEQLVEAAPQVAELLTQASRLKVLVTSRELLRLTGEQEYVVPSLTNTEAERLFAERAREAQPSFTPDERVASICRRLDNLPLALELAAARIKFMTTDTLLERLQQRLPLLIGGKRDQPQRQRTLRATIQWSYELLSEEEKDLFARLAVFAGGCTLEAAEEVAAAGLESLQSLIDKSLLYQARGRYFMLETIREFGLELLGGTDEMPSLRSGHARFFLALLRSSDDPHGVLTVGGRPFRERVAPELDNARSAIEWALATDDVELAVQLIYTSDVLPISMRESANWYDRSLKRSHSMTDATAAASFLDASFQKALLGEVAEAEVFCERSLELYRKLADPAGEGESLRTLGTISTLAERPKEARRYFDLALDLAEMHGLDDLRGAVLHGLGACEVEFGDAERARQLLTESIALSQAGGNPILAGLALIGLAELLLVQGELDRAEERYAEVLVLFRELMFNFGVMNAVAGLAATAAKRGDAVWAGTLWGAALAFERKSEAPFVGRDRLFYERALASVAGRQFDAAMAVVDGADLDAVVEDALARCSS